VREILSAHFPRAIDPQIDRAIRERYDIRIRPELMRPGNSRWPSSR
jgi:hypothetical protein